MSTMQRVLIAIYLPITIVILLMDWFYPDHTFVRIFKFSSIAALLIVSLFINQKYYEQKMMTSALLFAALGDFLLGFGGRLEVGDITIPLGMLSFFSSYTLLILVFSKKHTYKKKEMLAALPFLIGYFFLIITLIPYIYGTMLVASLIFGLILAFMGWSAVSTIFRSYYSKRTSVLMASAGILIFISDIAVANAIFHPTFNHTFVPWLENIIWITFVPAWTFVVMAIAEKNLYKRSKN